MLHDEDKYPDPETFKPERWLDVERHRNVYPLEIAFGFGRRWVLGILLWLAARSHERTCSGCALAGISEKTSCSRLWRGR